jgi:hypothetical protein
MVLKRALADRVVLAAAFCVVLFGATLVAAIPADSVSAAAA